MSISFSISLIYLASALVLFLTAGIILRENVKSSQNRVVSAMLFFAGIAPFLVSLYETIIIDPSKLSLTIINIFYVWELFFPVLLWFSVLFPEPLPVYRRHKRLLQLAFVPHIFHIIMVIALNDPEQIIRMVDFDTSIPVLGFLIGLISSILKLVATFFGFLYSFHSRFFSLINLAYVCTSIYFLSLGYRRINNPALRIQVKVVIAGIIAAVGIYVIGVIIPTILSIKIPDIFTEVMILTALVVGPGTIAWAIIKYRFLDIGLIARQSLVYTLTTAIVVGGYLLIINQLSSFFFSVFGFQSRILDIMVVVIMLLFFQPLYTQVDDFVRRLFIRSRSDYRHLMEELSRKLIAVFDVLKLANIINDTLNEEMFIEKTYFALITPDGANYKLIGESREFSIETDILELLLEKQRPIFLNNLKRLAREGNLIGHFGELNCQLLMPLADKGKLVGIIATSPKAAGYGYTYEDVTLLTVLANQVIVALNNARLYAESLEKQRLEEELAVARQIQIDLLPKAVPVHNKFEFAAFNHPSRQVGGDYYDFINKPDGQVCIVVADVSGKGVGAALLGARLQAVLQSEGQRGRPIDIMIAAINDFLVDSTASDKFVTMFYCELDCELGVFYFCNAGHNYPFIVRSNNHIDYLVDGGLILGALPGSQYQIAKLDLAKGDVLVIYTDGLSEAFNEHGEEYGEDRLVKAVQDARSKSAHFICGHMIKNIRQFASDTSEVDDMTVVVIKGT
ncbi:MAG: SpoIIE family protein phosphatase [candidate division Zixibacteria bacterium]|nr:SpoIIE family protein phosphatase [candidate division Zixibacteria bacterium]